MDCFNIYIKNKYIFSLFSDSECRAIELTEIFCKDNKNIKVVKKDKENVCSGCKEKIFDDTFCSCWGF